MLLLIKPAASSITHTTVRCMHTELLLLLLLLCLLMSPQDAAFQGNNVQLKSPYGGALHAERLEQVTTSY
jgi:hypothetical protein